VKILWLGNPPDTPSGYGEQAALFIPRFEALGHEVAVACNWGFQGVTRVVDGRTHYPSDGLWGNSATGTYANDFGADVVVALCDAWTMKPDEWAEGLRMAIWAPVDHLPLPPLVRAVLDHENIRPIAMSRFGEQQMKNFGLDPLYVPHGVDTSLFRPKPELRDQVREMLNVPLDAFLVGMVAANKSNPSVPRKGFDKAFHGFARFAKDHPDAYLYVHSEAQPNGGGMDLTVLAHAVGCPADRVIFPPEESWQLGMGREVVATLYQAFDVLLNPSMGEGFGIPIIEAQASGVPVIASDHSSMTELTQAGWLVSGDPSWDALQTRFLIVPFISSVHAALESAYEQRDNQELRDGAVAFAQQYDADVVTREFWVPALEALTRPREVPPLNGNRAQRRASARAKAKAGARVAA
jgi:glycosyltransferase involved in cell wall biosynthesis